jgi:hypothetical protein
LEGEEMLELLNKANEPIRSYRGKGNDEEQEEDK